MDLHNQGITPEHIDDIVNKTRAGRFPGEEALKHAEDQLSDLIDNAVDKRTVVGFDVYRYSSYSKVPQVLVPHVLSVLIETTLRDLDQHEAAFFSESYRIDPARDLIDTGDGGYVIFPDPLRALVFLMYFQSNLLIYNTGNRWPEFTWITRGLSIRYAMTFNAVYLYKNKWFGPAIIHNARILAADRLNRLLVDDNVKEWFDLTTNGVETLSMIPMTDLRKVRFGHTLPDDTSRRSFLFPQSITHVNTIRSVNLSRVGEIIQKGQTLSVHNLHLQFYLTRPSAEINKHVVTLGNLNSSGLGEV